MPFLVAAILVVRLIVLIPGFILFVVGAMALISLLYYRILANPGFLITTGVIAVAAIFYYWPKSTSPKAKRFRKPKGPISYNEELLPEDRPIAPPGKELHRVYRYNELTQSSMFQYYYIGDDGVWTFVRPPEDAKVRWPQPRGFS